ncbi:hypothetical protein V6R21_31385 [Limibacter armeniacum]|uniref:hypothetical protein n=1 Tax=Limibacter armeniacum TaxID=466084 RepID=UPI002FE634D3
MNRLLILLVLLALSSVSVAQVRQGRIEAYRKNFITEQLALSTKDSAQFWKVYDEYTEKQVAIRNEMRELATGSIAKSDEQLKKDIDRTLALEQESLDLKKTYMNKLSSVLTVRQLAALLQVEEKLKRKLLEQVANRRRR